MNDLKKIVIVGAGGLGREVLATVRACNAAQNEWNVLGFLDADSSLAGREVGGVPILGGDEWCRTNNNASVRFICAIGSPNARSKTVGHLLAVNCQFASIVHPSVRVPESVQVGVGTVI